MKLHCRLNNINELDLVYNELVKIAENMPDHYFKMKPRKNKIDVYIQAKRLTKKNK